MIRPSKKNNKEKPKNPNQDKLKRLILLPKLKPEII